MPDDNLKILLGAVFLASCLLIGVLVVTIIVMSWK
jgi:hypothetical protein